MTSEAARQWFAENLDQKIEALQSDIGTLNAIESGQIDTKSFDFDGRKYVDSQAVDIRRQLEDEKIKLEAERTQRDRASVQAFYAHALARHPDRAGTLLEAWRSANEAGRWRFEFAPHANAIFVTIHYLSLNGFNVAVDMARDFRALHDEHEPELRELFRKMPDLGAFPVDLQEKIKKIFLDEPIAYHHYEQPHQTNLETLRAVIVEINQDLSDLYFNRLKAVLVLQEQLLN